MKRIVLCADDYGQAPAISQGILTLIQNNRLSATSCIVNHSAWPVYASQLLVYKHQIDIGLHFNLTEGQPLSKQYIAKYGDTFFSLSGLLTHCFLRKIDRLAIEAECDAQIDCFVKALGFLPDYIDGHQHVHQFPVIRQALVNIYNKRLLEKKPYIRIVKQKIRLKECMTNFKKIIIHILGSSSLERLLLQHQIPHNGSFSGIYSFAGAPQYKEIFPIFLKEIKDKGLIMCHPASSPTGDSIANARYAEYEYFSSNQFLRDCENQQIVIGRFRPLS